MMTESQYHGTGLPFTITSAFPCEVDRIGTLFIRTAGSYNGDKVVYHPNVDILGVIVPCPFIQPGVARHL